MITNDFMANKSKVISEKCCVQLNTQVRARLFQKNVKYTKLDICVHITAVLDDSKCVLNAL